MRQMHSLTVVVVLALASLAGPVSLMGQQPVTIATDPAAMSALMQAASGTYTVTGSRLAPTDRGAAIPVFVQADALRPAEGSGVRVPLAVGVAASAPWVMQVRVTRQGDPSAGPAPGELTLAGQAGLAREIREVTLEPGDYELTIAVAARRDGRQWIGTTQRQALSVPNLSAGLAASPVVLGERVSAAGPGDTGRPFVFGPSALTPAAINRFRQSDRIHVALRINGWKGDTESKPDVSVEYVVQQQLKDQFRFFNKTKPQELNAKTLAKTFDGQAGILAAGMIIPLAAFPPGEFQLVVRVKDKRTGATTIQKTTFVVQS